MRYDIFNPTTAPRVIYDGIDGQQRKITVLPGETKKDVELADHIASGFHYAPTDEVGDLVLAPLGQEPLEAATLKPLPSDYVRYQAPPTESQSDKTIIDWYDERKAQGLPSDPFGGDAHNADKPPTENSALELCADPAALLSADRPKRGRRRKVIDALPQWHRDRIGE